MLEELSSTSFMFFSSQRIVPKYSKSHRYRCQILQEPAESIQVLEDSSSVHQFYVFQQLVESIRVLEESSPTDLRFCRSQRSLSLSTGLNCILRTLFYARISVRKIEFYAYYVKIVFFSISSLIFSKN